MVCSYFGGGGGPKAASNWLARGAALSITRATSAAAWVGRSNRAPRRAAIADAAPLIVARRALSPAAVEASPNRADVGR